MNVCSSLSTFNLESFYYNTECDIGNKKYSTWSQFLSPHPTKFRINIQMIFDISAILLFVFKISIKDGKQSGALFSILRVCFFFASEKLILSENIRFSW